MATYAELAAIEDDASYAAFFDKVVVACIIKATALIDTATPTAAQVAWATSVLSNPRDEASSIVRYVIAANDNAAISAIVGAGDSAIQTNVDAAADKITGV